MPEQVPFINRENELTLIDKLIREWGTLRMLCINAPGGIGKTRLLQEVHNRYTRSEQVRLIVTDIIDFDDRIYHLPENVGRRIAQMLDLKTFQPYLRELLDYRKMEIIGISSERLAQAFLEVDRIFMECFSKISDQKRIMLSVDTTDALKGTDFWDYLVRMASQLKNVLILISGRNARKIGHFLQSDLDENIVQIINLPPLLKKAGEEYLQQKQKLLHIELEPELAQKLLLLSGGSPILIDLAVEWRARGISLDWLVKSSLKELQSLSEHEMEERQQEFGRQLVTHIAQTRTQTDWLILLMSRVYPLSIEMIAALRDISEEQAKRLFEEAKTYVFVKLLPDGRITLHDETRRMVNDYVWPEVDPEEHLRRRDSELVAKYLENKTRAMTSQIDQLEEKEKIAAEKGEVEAELNAFAERETLEREMWTLKEQHLSHVLFVDLSEGVKVFIDTFDEATQKYEFSYRGTLLIQIQQYVDKLSVEQLYEVNSRRVKYLANRGGYLEAKELITNILDNADVTPEQQVDMLILCANAEIRLGHVKKGISDFERAVRISEANTLPIWNIRALNGLGYAHRLTGNLGAAQEYYHKARSLCLKEGGPYREELRGDYGWLSNNLAFVLSNKHKTRVTAIDIALSAINHWCSIENDIGLGAGYLVLGIAYYRNDNHEESLKAFQKALDIFEPLELDDWLGQIFSWRGAQYHHIREAEKAKRDLERSLEIGSPNIEAMTLNRLGRVYMLLGQWDKAEEYMAESLKRAKEIPDYLYWLASVGRLATIAAEKGEYDRLDEFNQMLRNFEDEIATISGKADESTLGIVYLGLAKLTLGQDEPDINNIVKFLQMGITLITDNGPYSHRDILNRLEEFSKHHFPKIRPEIVRSIGQALKNYVSQKESEDIAYSVVAPIMYEWADWKKRR